MFFPQFYYRKDRPILPSLIRIINPPNELRNWLNYSSINNKTLKNGDFLLFFGFFYTFNCWHNPNHVSLSDQHIFVFDTRFSDQSTVERVMTHQSIFCIVLASLYNINKTRRYKKHTYFSETQEHLLF